MALRRLSVSFTCPARAICFTPSCLVRQECLSYWAVQGVGTRANAGNTGQSWGGYRKSGSRPVIEPVIAEGNVTDLQSVKPDGY
jgi:hypothetical protein